MEKGVEKHACTMYAWTALVFVQMKTSSDKCFTCDRLLAAGPLVRHPEWRGRN